MTVFIPRNYGPPLSGIVGLAAPGTTRDAATLITQQVSIFTSVALNGLAELPSVGGSNVAIYVVNMDAANALGIVPPAGGQINTFGANVQANIAAAGGWGLFISLSTPFNAGQQWYLLALAPGGSFIGLPSSDAGLPTGSLWRNGAFVCVAGF